jgi:hypothetical protein
VTRRERRARIKKRMEMNGLKEGTKDMSSSRRVVPCLWALYEKACRKTKSHKGDSRKGETTTDQRVRVQRMEMTKRL